MTKYGHANAIAPQTVTRTRSPGRADQEIERARHTNLLVSKKKAKTSRKVRQAAKKEHRPQWQSDGDRGQLRQSASIATCLAVAFIEPRKKKKETVSEGDERRPHCLRSQNEFLKGLEEDTRAGKAVPLLPILEIVMRIARLDETVAIGTETMNETRIATGIVRENVKENENGREKEIVIDVVAVPGEETTATEETTREVNIVMTEEIGIETARRNATVSEKGTETDLERGIEKEIATTTEDLVTKEETGRGMKGKEIGIETETEILIGIDQNASYDGHNIHHSQIPRVLDTTNVPICFQPNLSDFRAGTQPATRQSISQLLCPRRITSRMISYHD